MEDIDQFGDAAGGTIFRDVILLTLIGFVAMVIMLLPHISRTKEEAADHRAPGNVIVEMHWPSHLTVDVDLWVKAPGVGPVGFWNQGNEVFNLLRDDLGAEGDATDENYEVAYSRGIPAGEYVVNAHMYGPVPDNTSVPVSIVVSVRKQYEDTQQILNTLVRLTYHNQEETAFRFRLTGDGALVPDSVNTLRRPLITELM